MSWLHDKLLSEQLRKLEAPTGFGEDNRLAAFGSRNYTRQTNFIAAGFTPMNPSASMCEATGCTFDNSQIFDLFVQYTASASNITTSDFFYWGRVNAVNKNDHSPPYIYCFVSSAVTFAEGSFCGLYHVLSKEGWLIGGISYPSEHVCGRITT